MLLRGRRTELIDINGRELLDREDDFWILTDKTERYFGKCEVILCQCVRVLGEARKLCREDDLREAKSYYEKKRFRSWEPKFSLGSWRSLANVAEIRYLRGEEPPPFAHEFSSPVSCEISLSLPVTYRITLPRRCILNNHGFVEP